MTTPQEAIFDRFKQAIIEKISPYFSELGFIIDDLFKEESQWIAKTYVRQTQEVNFSLSLHHLDYRDGIQVELKADVETIYLRTEVQKYSKAEVPIYKYSAEKIDAEFDRILKDFKTHLEKYIVNRK